MQAPNLEFLGCMDSLLSVTWCKTSLRKLAYFILYLQKGTKVSNVSKFS